MLFTAVLSGHVLAAISVGPIFTLPFLANNPTALRAVLLLLRFSASATLVSGALLWVMLKPAHPLWLGLSAAFFFAVIALVGLVLSPAAKRLSEEPEMTGRIRWVGSASSALVLGIAALMVVGPSWL